MRRSTNSKSTSVSRCAARPNIGGMATATPSPSPNPNALRFGLDVTLADSMNVPSADAAKGNSFAEAVFAAPGVASIFGVNDFVTITRKPGADWDPIIAAVQEAAAQHL